MTVGRSKSQLHPQVAADGSAAAAPQEHSASDPAADPGVLPPADVGAGVAPVDPSATGMHRVGVSIPPANPMIHPLVAPTGVAAAMGHIGTPRAPDAGVPPVPIAPVTDIGRAIASNDVDELYAQASALRTRGWPLVIADGTPALIAAVKRTPPNIQMVEMLLRMGCPIDAKDSALGNTALHWAAQSQAGSESAALMGLLLMFGACIHLTNKAGQSAIDLAVARRDRSAYDMLSAAGARPSVQSPHGLARAPLGAVTVACDAATLRSAMAARDFAALQHHIVTLLDHNLPLQASDGTPLLAIAAQCSAPADVIKFLMASGCSINAQDKNGNTPLIWAAYGGNAALVSYVIECGADVRIKNTKGLTALQFAYKEKFEDVERVLLHAGAMRTSSLKPGELIRERRRAAKLTLQQHPIAELPQDVQERRRLPSAPEVLCSRTYIEDARLRSLVQREIDVAYNSPTLRPLMDLMAFAGLGAHRDVDGSQAGGGKQKVLKVFMTPDVGALATRGKDPIEYAETKGLFTHKHSIFVSTHNRPSIRSIFESMVHEGAHWAMLLIFGNECRPYCAGDRGSDGRDRVQGVIDITYERLRELPQGSADDVRASKIMATVFLPGYSREVYANELIVRVPQIIAALGEENGILWLATHVPELWTYFLEYVQPAFVHYLTEHHVELVLGPRVAVASASASASATAGAEVSGHAISGDVDARAYQNGAMYRDPMIR